MTCSDPFYALRPPSVEVPTHVSQRRLEAPVSDSPSPPLVDARSGRCHGCRTYYRRGAAGWGPGCGGSCRVLVLVSELGEIREQQRTHRAPVERLVFVVADTKA